MLCRRTVIWNGSSDKSQVTGGRFALRVVFLFESVQTYNAGDIGPELHPVEESGDQGREKSPQGVGILRSHQTSAQGLFIFLNTRIKMDLLLLFFL